MEQDQPFAEVLASISAGRLTEARHRLQTRRFDAQHSNALMAAALNADLDLATGELIAAQKAAEALLANGDATHFKAAARRVLGEVYANRLDFETSLEHFRAARALCV